MAIDYERSLPEYIRPSSGPARDDGDASVRYWYSLVALTSRKLAKRDAHTLRLRVAEYLEFLGRWVPEAERRAVERASSGADPDEIAAILGLEDPDAVDRVVSRARERLLYRPALELWCQDQAYADIARALGLSGAKDAERIVRDAKRILRHHFRGVDG